MLVTDLVHPVSKRMASCSTFPHLAATRNNKVEGWSQLLNPAPLLCTFSSWQPFPPILPEVRWDCLAMGHLGTYTDLQKVMKLTTELKLARMHFRHNRVKGSFHM